MSRSIKSAVFYTSLLVLCALSWWHLQKSETLPVTTVKVITSYEHLTHEEITAAVSPYINDGFFGVNVAQLRESVLSLPWAESVSVTRIWPDTLILNIDEQKAAARWNDKGLINVHGELFLPDKEVVTSNLANLLGPSSQHVQVVRQYRLMSEMLAPLGLVITSLELTNRRAWRLQLNNGMTLLLGRHDADKRMIHFVKAYHQVFGSNGSEADLVDLRYSNGMSVHWRS